MRQARRSGTIPNRKTTAGMRATLTSSSRMSHNPKGVRTVQVPTWSDKDGQDDIRWQEAT